MRFTWSPCKHCQVDLGGRGFRRPEQDVGDLRGDHGAAPAVRQGAPHGLDQEVDGVVVHPHVGAVHHFGDFPVHAPGINAQVPPFLQPGGGQAPGEGEVALLDAVFLHHGQGQFLGLGQGREVTGHPELRGQAVQLGLIGDAEARRLAFTHGEERFQQVPAVVGVGLAAPAATMRARFRATMMSASAPQTPRWGPSPNGSMRQGPMTQMRQESPSSQKPHCGSCAAARSQTVSRPSLRPCLSGPGRRGGWKTAYQGKMGGPWGFSS